MPITQARQLSLIRAVRQILEFTLMTRQLIQRELELHHQQRQTPEVTINNIIRTISLDPEAQLAQPLRVLDLELQSYHHTHKRNEYSRRYRQKHRGHAALPAPHQRQALQPIKAPQTPLIVNEPDDEPLKPFIPTADPISLEDFTQSEAASVFDQAQSNPTILLIPQKRRK
jgi:hypothetical protein